MEIPVTLHCKQMFFLLALVAREGTEMVEKVKRETVRRMSRLSHLKALLSFLQPLDKFPDTSKNALQSSSASHSTPPLIPSPCEDGWPLRGFSAPLRLWHKKQKQEFFCGVGLLRCLEQA